MNEKRTNLFVRDLDTIKSGYMPRNNFMLLNNVIPILILLKLVAYGLNDKYIKGIFNLARPRKSYHLKIELKNPKTDAIDYTKSTYDHGVIGGLYKDEWIEKSDKTILLRR